MAEKRVKEALEKAGKEAADKATKAAAEATAKAGTAKARAGAIAEHLKGVPAIYADKLGDDPTKWAAEAKAAREAYQADLTAAGIKAPPLSSGSPGGGVGPAALIGNAGSAFDQVQEGLLKANRPVVTFAQDSAVRK